MRKPKFVTKSDMKDWLQSKSSLDIVGYACMPKSCVISMYFKELYPEAIFVHSGEEMTRLEFFVSKKIRIYDLDTPEWASLFIESIDESSRVYGQEVSAKLALEILLSQK